MPRRLKKEGMYDQNDSLVIVKADGGLVEAEKVYQEFDELHSDQDGATIDVQHKIPVLEATVFGRPPIQTKTTYYIDEEQRDCGFDPSFMFGKLKSAYNLSITKGTHEAEGERKHRRNMDIIFVCAGACLLMFAFFLAPLMGWSLNTGSTEPPPPPVVEVAPSRTTPLDLTEEPKVEAPETSSPTRPGREP